MGEGNSPVVAVDHALGIGGVNPKGVMVRVNQVVRNQGFKIRAAVGGNRSDGVQAIDTLGIFWVHPNVAEIERPRGHIGLGVHRAETVTPVI